jgi:UDP-N-acetyl-D-mannosaminuronic acid dehydrogenase
MIYELKNNNRTIGASDRETGERIKKIYSSFCLGEIVVTDIKTAEMTKVIENTYRAINIGFANELAKICSYTGMDVYEIIKICNMHPRVNILNPGPGVGGHCIAVDPWFLVGDYPEMTSIIRESMKVNESMPEFVLERAYSIMKENNITDISRVGIYGLTYKENVDDYRDSPALQLINFQKKHLATPLKSYDPYIKEDIVENQCHDFDEFLDGLDIVIIMVRHDEIAENENKLRGKLVLDTVHICKKIDTYSL